MKRNTLVFAALLVAVLLTSCSAQEPKNVILIIPDGCSMAMWASIRAMTVGTDGELNIDKLAVQSRSRTYSANSMITDSAAAGTAMACGSKTNNGLIGMDAATVRGDSLTGKPMASILELAEAAGYATGVVTTTSIQHATPASFYAHQADRNWYNNIAEELVGSGIEVIMGGGREFMLPEGTVGEENVKSARKDKRNIIEELRAGGYTVVNDDDGFNSVDPVSTDRLLGIFNGGMLQYEFDRANDTDGEPALWEMADKAIKILSNCSKHPKGFFLMVEAGRIDHAAHGNDAQRFLWDGIACDKTVGVAMDFARNNPNTLLIVVPDHGCGGPHLIGMYDPSDPEGKVITYERFLDYTLDENGFPADDNGKPIAIGWSSSPFFLDGAAFDPAKAPHGNHTGEDVGLHAMGPTSEKLMGLNQNTDVFRVIAEYLGVAGN